MTDPNCVACNGTGVIDDPNGGWTDDCDCTPAGQIKTLTKRCSSLETELVDLQDRIDTTLTILSAFSLPSTLYPAVQAALTSKARP